MFYVNDGSHSKQVQLEADIKVEKFLVHDCYKEVRIIKGGLIDTEPDKIIRTNEYSYQIPECNTVCMKLPSAV